MNFTREHVPVDFVGTARKTLLLPKKARVLSVNWNYVVRSSYSGQTVPAFSANIMGANVSMEAVTIYPSGTPSDGAIDPEMLVFHIIAPSRDVGFEERTFLLIDSGVSDVGEKNYELLTDFANDGTSLKFVATAAAVAIEGVRKIMEEHTGAMLHHQEIHVFEIVREDDKDTEI